jgi:hypothetical protein
MGEFKFGKLGNPNKKPGNSIKNKIKYLLRDF